MSIRVRSLSIGTLVGGDLAVDISHLSDSIKIGDGTNIMGPLTLSGGVYAVPVDVKVLSGDIAKNTVQTDGTQKTKITDGVDTVGISTIGGSSKAIKVDVIASVGGGGGGTAMTDGGVFTEATTSFTPIGGEYQTAPGALTNARGYAARLNAKRHLMVQLTDSADNELLGQKVMASSVPVVIASNQGGLAVTGTFWQATQPVSLTGNQAVNLAQVGGAAYALGTAGIAASMPVTLADEEILAQSLVAVNNAVTSTMKGSTAYGFAITGTFVATITFEYTQDNTTWNAMDVFPVGGGAVVTTATAAGNWQAVDQGYKAVRARVSAYTSGTAVVSLVAKAAVTAEKYGQRTMVKSVPVVIASDQGAFPVSQSGTNWSQNIAQINGVTPLMGNGVTGTGALRVTVASDNTAFAVNAACTGAAATNHMDVGAINGVTPLMGNGVTGTGSQRVTIASDNTAFSVNATCTQGTAANLKVMPDGTVAHGAVDSGNPLKVGGKVYTTSLTNEVAGDRVDFITDAQGAQVTVLNKPRGFIRTQQTTITASVTETTIITAGAAGVFNDIVSLTITNSSATALIVTLKDSTAGTTRAIYAIAANGGITIPFATPLAQQAAAANAWTLTCGTSVSSIYVSAVYIINT